MSTNRGRRPQHRRPLQSAARSQHGAPSKKVNLQRLHDQYLQRARAALDSGDRITAENFYQHADHYFRMIEATVA